MEYVKSSRNSTYPIETLSRSTSDYYYDYVNSPSEDFDSVDEESPDESVSESTTTENTDMNLGSQTSDEPVTATNAENMNSKANFESIENYETHA